MNTAVTPLFSPDELDRGLLQQALRERARAMVPRLRERAPHTAELHHLPEETVEEMIEAGFLRILQPARHGGYELDPKDFFHVQITLAEGCMSTAWVLGVVAIHNWQLALFDERAQRDVWGTNEDTLISSSYMPVGKVKRAEGGYRLSGKWSFSSGSEHCNWAFLGAMVPPEKEGDMPDYRTFLVPRGEYRIEVNWDVSGLEGTGSDVVVVEDAFVPEYRTHRAIDGFNCSSPGNAVNTNPLFRLPFGQIFVRAVCSSSIGALQATAAAGNLPAIEDRVKMRYDAALVAPKCADAVNKLLIHSGAQSIYRSHPINRAWLDINAGRTHVANNAGKFARNRGACQFGFTGEDIFL